MSCFCVETSAYSNFKRGAPKVVEIIDRRGLQTISGLPPPP